MCAEIRTHLYIPFFILKGEDVFIFPFFKKIEKILEGDVQNKMSKKNTPVSRMKALIGEEGIKRIGTFMEATGGGEPIPKGQTLAQNPQIRRVMQPRDDDGRFTYNSMNAKGRKYEYHGKGNSTPPVLVGRKWKEFFTEDDKYKDGNQIYWFGARGSMQDIIESYRTFNEVSQSFGEMAQGNMEIKKGRRSAEEKAATPDELMGADMVFTKGGYVDNIKQNYIKISESMTPSLQAKAMQHVEKRKKSKKILEEQKKEFKGIENADINPEQFIQDNQESINNIAEALNNVLVQKGVSDDKFTPNDITEMVKDGFVTTVDNTKNVLVPALMDVPNIKYTSDDGDEVAKEIIEGIPESKKVEGATAKTNNETPQNIPTEEKVSNEDELPKSVSNTEENAPIETEEEAPAKVEKEAKVPKKVLTDEEKQKKYDKIKKFADMNAGKNIIKNFPNLSNMIKTEYKNAGLGEISEERLRDFILKSDSKQDIVNRIKNMAKEKGIGPALTGFDKVKSELKDVKSGKASEYSFLTTYEKEIDNIKRAYYKANKKVPSDFEILDLINKGDSFESIVENLNKNAKPESKWNGETKNVVKEGEDKDLPNNGKYFNQHPELIDEIAIIADTYGDEDYARNPKKAIVELVLTGQVTKLSEFEQFMAKVHGINKKPLRKARVLVEKDVREREAKEKAEEEKAKLLFKGVKPENE